MRLYTEEAYKQDHQNRSPQQDGYTPRWYSIKGENMFGVTKRMIREGAFDVCDEDVEGIEDQEVVDDGQQVVREGQQDVKYNAFSKDLNALVQQGNFHRPALEPFYSTPQVWW